MPVQCLEGRLNSVIVAIYDEGIALRSKDVVGDNCLNLGQNQITGLIDVEPSRSYAVGCGKFGKFLDNVIINRRRTQELLVVAHLLKSRTVFLTIGKGKTL